MHIRLPSLIAVALLSGGLACQPTQQASEQTSQVGPVPAPTPEEAALPIESDDQSADTGKVSQADLPLVLSLIEASQDDGLKLVLKVDGEVEDPASVQLVTVYLNEEHGDISPGDALAACRPAGIHGTTDGQAWLYSKAVEADSELYAGMIERGGDLSAMLTDEGTLHRRLKSLSDLGIDYLGKGAVHVWLRDANGEAASNTLTVPADFSSE